MELLQGDGARSIGYEDSMDTYNLIKRASAFAREKEFNKAIAVLNEVYVQGEPDVSTLIKVIPYFQKAGRYDELQAYCKNILIPQLSISNKNIFSHKCQEIQQAFENLGLHKLYSKLELCAKREKNEHDRLAFHALSTSHYLEYERYLAIGEKKELRKGFEKMVSIFGEDTNEWPESVRKRYTDI
ncbi:hypothetical protein BA893_13780 [Vibrio natriegens]|nr:hypothetical protein BA893_13780 [Vibrio natriegens]